MMRCFLLCVAILFVAAAASAEDYQVGEYYAPYGRCTGVTPRSTETVYYPPSTYYQTERVAYPEYRSRDVYYSPYYNRPRVYREHEYPTRTYHYYTTQ